MNFFTERNSMIVLADICHRDCHGIRGYPGSDLNINAILFDADSRRWLKVTVKGGRRALLLEREPDGSTYYDTICTPKFVDHAGPIFAGIRAELDAGPSNLAALEVSVDGEVLCRSTDPRDDSTVGTHYAPIGDYHIPGHIKTLGRDELVEVSRLIAFVDVVTPRSSPSPEEERLVFKYYQHPLNLPGHWNSVHIGAKLWNHPHIAPVRHVVVDETDRSRVVGYTVPFYPGGTLASTTHSRTFKLKWAKQLFQTLDDLHFKYGVLHGDCHAHNMLIDPATDNLVLIDFGCSAKIGSPHPSAHLRAALTHIGRSVNPMGQIAADIKAAFQEVYCLVTGAGSTLKEPGDGIPTIVHMKEGGWVKGPGIMLDSPAEEYYKLCMDWLRRRNAGPKITEHNQASEPLDYPDYMPPPQVDIDASKTMKAKEQAAQIICDARCEANKITCKAREQAEKIIAEAKLASQIATSDAAETSNKAIASTNSSPKPVPVPETPQPPQGPDYGTMLLEDMMTEGCLFFDAEEWFENAYMDPDPVGTSGRYFLRYHAVKAGHKFLNWERPSRAQLDRTRRLLANGKYEEGPDNRAGATTSKANKRKREHSVAAECAGKTNMVTKRITRSAARKQQADIATQSARKPPAPKAAAPKGTTTRKGAPSSKGGEAAAASTTRARLTNGTR